MASEREGNWRIMRLGRKVLWPLLLLGVGPAVRLGAATATNHSPEAVWDVSARAEVGGGYKHNVLLTSVSPENSPFVLVSADVSFIRLSETGSEFTMFFLGEDTQYTDAPSVGGERFASGTLQYAQPVGGQDQLALEFSTLYQNQIMDVSDTETNLSRILVDGVGMALKPRWTHQLSSGWETRIETFGGPQLYAAPVDSYWEAGSRAALARTYGHKSELTLGGQFAHWIYHDREQNDTEGNPVPNTALTFWRPEVFGQWRHHWDAQKRWATTTRLGWLWNLDNGSGYWNYDRLAIGQKVRWRDSGWEIAAGVKFGWYRYAVQMVGAEHRERIYTTIDVRVERRLSTRWYFYAAAGSDWNWSNQSLDQYSDWTAGAGIGAEF